MNASASVRPGAVPVFGPAPVVPRNLGPGDFLARVPPFPDPEHRFMGLPVKTEAIDGRQVRLFADVGYVVASGRFSGALSTVRAGFVFDWASVPRIFWRVFPPSGDGHNHYWMGAIWHDWAYAHREIAGQPCTRAEADALFLEIMTYVKVNPVVRRLMYLAVRAGGWLPWDRRSRKLEGDQE